MASTDKGAAQSFVANRPKVTLGDWLAWLREGEHMEVER